MVEATFIGLDNYRAYFASPAFWSSLRNTIDTSLTTTPIAVPLVFLYAYALTRTRIRCKAFFRYTALTPIFMSTVVHTLGLIYLFGRQGVLTRLGFEIELYGRLGIIISQVIYTFPQAFLMFFMALGRLYEVTDSSGCATAHQNAENHLAGSEMYPHQRHVRLLHPSLYRLQRAPDSGRQL